MPKRDHSTEVPLPIHTTALPHTWRTPFELASARCRIRRGTIGLLASTEQEFDFIVTYDRDPIVE